MASAAELRRLIGQYHRRPDIHNGSQQDMEENTRLLLACIEKELENCKESASEFMNEFIGQEMNIRLFFNTGYGGCRVGHVPRSEPEIFRIIRLILPEMEKQLSLNNLIHDHYSLDSEIIMMKCSDFCVHPSDCPQTGVCKLREAAGKRCLLVTPKFLYIQLLRFANHNRKIQSVVIPENILVLPNGDKYKLVSIGNHLGS